MNKTLVWQTHFPQSSHPLPPRISLWRQWRNYTHACADRWCFSERTCSHTHLFSNDPFRQTQQQRATQILWKGSKLAKRKWLKQHSTLKKTIYFHAFKWDLMGGTAPVGAVVPPSSSEDIYIQKAAFCSHNKNIDGNKTFERHQNRLLLKVPGSTSANTNQKESRRPFPHLLSFLYFLNSHFYKIIQIFFFLSFYLYSSQ